MYRMKRYRNAYATYTTYMQLDDQKVPIRAFFSSIWYRIFFESYRSRLSPGVMETFYLLSTFAKRESSNICCFAPMFLFPETYCQSNRVFLCQAVYDGSPLERFITLNSILCYQAVSDSSTSGQLIRLPLLFYKHSLHERYAKATIS